MKTLLLLAALLPLTACTTVQATYGRTRDPAQVAGCAAVGRFDRGADGRVGFSQRAFREAVDAGFNRSLVLSERDGATVEAAYRCPT